MAITRCSDWLENDSRFKSWGKKISGTCHVDLSKSNGYSLTGPWVRWDDAVSLGSGEYLVVAAETGSRASHDYKYRLVVGGETPRRIEKSEREAVISAACADGGVSESQNAQQQNNLLYSYALFISLSSQAQAQAQAQVAADPTDSADSAEIEHLRTLASRLVAFASPAEAQESVDAWARLQALGVNPRI